MNQDEHDVKVNAFKLALTKVLDDALDTLDKHHRMCRQRLIDEYKQSLRLIDGVGEQRSVKVNEPPSGTTASHPTC